MDNIFSRIANGFEIDIIDKTAGFDILPRLKSWDSLDLLNITTVI